MQMQNDIDAILELIKGSSAEDALYRIVAYMNQCDDRIRELEEENLTLKRELDIDLM